MLESAIFITAVITNYILIVPEGLVYAMSKDWLPSWCNRRITIGTVILGGLDAKKKAVNPPLKNKL
jgi:hypothetical protein